MSIDITTPWGAAIDAAMKIIDRVIPDPAAKAAAQLQVQQLAESGKLAELQAQVELAAQQNNVNTAEAGSSNPFNSGWRPSVGWVCAVGLAYQFLGQPLLTWGSGIWKFPPPPALDLGSLLTLLMGMLGLGSLRTTEKIKGVA